MEPGMLLIFGLNNLGRLQSTTLSLTPCFRELLNCPFRWFAQQDWQTIGTLCIYRPST